MGYGVCAVNIDDIYHEIKLFARLYQISLGMRECASTYYLFKRLFFQRFVTYFQYLNGNPKLPMLCQYFSL
jgi:hypothetical protein